MGGNAIASQKGAVEYDFEEAVRLLERARDIFRSESLLDSEEGIGLLTDLGQAQAKLKLFESAIISYTACFVAFLLVLVGSGQRPRSSPSTSSTTDGLPVVSVDAAVFTARFGSVLLLKEK